MPTQATSDSDLGFPAKGSLKRVPFPFLVRDIARTRSTGNLYLMAGDTKKVVFFVDGTPTVVRSNLPTEFLGQILTDQGLITQEQCDNTLEAIRRTGKKQGELLVEMGILSEGNLRYGLDEQLRIKLFEIFAWDEGRFQFKIGGEPGVSTSGFGIDGPVEAIVIAGVQERWNDDRARAQLKAFSDKYPTVAPRWTGDLAQALELLPEELYYLRSIDGSRTTDELLAKKNDPEVPQVSTLLMGLIAAGVVEPGETKQARKLPPPRPNLSPPSVADDTLVPRFEQLSVITEYEDTPLPDKPPGAPQMTGKHPRVPILPTEDEEMFRGLDGDESIVLDPRGLRPVARAAMTPTLPATRAGTPEPAAIGAVDESHFGDLAIDDDETDFSGLSSTSVPKPTPAPSLASKPATSGSTGSLASKPDSGKSPAPTSATSATTATSGSTGSLASRPDSGKSPAPTPTTGSLASKPDSGKSPTPTPTTGSLGASATRPDSGKSSLPQPPLGTRPDSGKSSLPQPPLGTRPDSGKSSLPQPPLGTSASRPDSGKSSLPQPPLGARLDSGRSATPLVATPAPASEPLMTPDPLGDLSVDDDLSLGDDFDGDIEMLDDDAMLDDLGDEPDLGDLGSEPDLGDDDELPASSRRIDDDDDDDLGALAARDGADDRIAGLTRRDPAPEEPPLDLGQMDDSGLSEPIGDSSLIGDDEPEPAPSTEEPESLSEPDPGMEDDLGDLGDDLGGDLGDGDLEDLELDDDALIEDDEDLGDDFPAGSQEDTDGGFAVDGGVESAEALGATRFSQGEDAMREGDYDQAVALFEDAYANGFDIAELHAHLAFARYRASGNDPETAQSSLDLLDYAESIDPGLPMLHAYRGAILVALGREEEANEFFDRALYLDPDNELALAYRRDEE